MEKAKDFLKSKGIIKEGYEKFYINWMDGTKEVELTQLLTEYETVNGKKKEESEIRYKDVIDLGFIRKNSNDNVFISEYGYDWFWCEKKLYKKISAVWDCETHKVEIRMNADEGRIIARHEVSGLNELKNWIKLLTSK
ncbi:hypothetical protein ACOKFD_15720 [Flagellimonas sp. S174]|uniref:hypothetical protein n=1 Tax=Flagellimonas sp. S174 TaxID=3410790 RepID=UPI003BF5761A